MGVRTQRDTDGVYVWTAQLIGSARGVGVFAHKANAKKWVEKVLGEGEWVNSPEDTYDTGSGKGIIDMCPVQGSDALIVVEPEGGE